MINNLRENTDRDLTEAVQATFYKCDFSQDNLLFFEESISLAD